MAKDKIYNIGTRVTIDCGVRVKANSRAAAEQVVRESVYALGIKSRSCRVKEIFVSDEAQRITVTDK